MDLFTEPLAHFQPGTGTIEEWNEAHTRIEDYLRAHRIHNKMHQTRIALKILQQAAILHAQNPSIPPVTLAIEQLNQAMERWFHTLLEGISANPKRVMAQGRLALLLTDAPSRWPYAFLNLDPPEELIQAIQTTTLKTGPNLHISHMVARPIDLGTFTEAAGQAFEMLERKKLLRLTLAWAILTLILISIFWFTR